MQHACIVLFSTSALNLPLILLRRAAAEPVAAALGRAPQHGSKALQQVSEGLQLEQQQQQPYRSTGSLNSRRSKPTTQRSMAHLLLLRLLQRWG